jgi:hypothetical protein
MLTAEVIEVKARERVANNTTIFVGFMNRFRADFKGIIILKLY